jgi:hypothetical protein
MVGTYHIVMCDTILLMVTAQIFGSSGCIIVSEVLQVCRDADEESTCRCALCPPSSTTLEHRCTSDLHRTGMPAIIERNES